MIKKEIYQDNTERENILNLNKDLRLIEDHPFENGIGELTFSNEPSSDSFFSSFEERLVALENKTARLELKLENLINPSS